MTARELLRDVACQYDARAASTMGGKLDATNPHRLRAAALRQLADRIDAEMKYHADRGDLDESPQILAALVRLDAPLEGNPR